MPAPLDPDATHDGSDRGDDLPSLPLADAPSRTGRRAWLVVAVCALPVLALAAVLVPNDPPEDQERPPDTAVAEIVPAAAWDGKESTMLPVTAEPYRGLANGDVITVRGEGFPPGVDVGIVMCTSQAAFGGGVAWCDIMNFDMATTDGQGTFTGTHRVRRFLEAGGTRWDCTTGTVDPDAWLAKRAAGTLGPDPSSWSCIIAAGMLSDYDVSGGMPLAFAPDGEPQDPVPLDPAGCAQIQTDAGLVPTCPQLDGGPRVDCPDDQVAVVASDGVTTCEAATSSDAGPSGTTGATVATGADGSGTVTVTIISEGDAPATSGPPTTTVGSATTAVPSPSSTVISDPGPATTTTVTSLGATTVP